MPLFGFQKYLHEVEVYVIKAGLVLTLLMLV